MKKKIITLKDCYKAYTRDLDKACPPEETVSRFRKRLKEENLDVLKEVVRVDNGRLDIPVYFSVCGEDAEEIVGTKKQMGKGSTPEQAQASACMELAERFSFFSFMRDSGNFISAAYPEVKDKYPVMPLELLLKSVHDERTTAARLAELLAEVPIDWAWGRNLTSGEEVLVPFSWFYAINEFNGPSAGNTIEEAVSQGLCEVVERHVSSLVCHGRLETPAIAHDSLRDPVALELLGKFKRCGIEVYFNDLTLDTGIPTVAALAVDPATFPETSEIVFTAGTTPQPEKSLIRALTEVAQLAGDFNSGSNYIASGLPKPHNLTEVEYITNTGAAIRTEDMADLGHDNIRMEVENCLAALKGLGLEVFVLDITHPRLGIPAVYVIVPGAHFRERSRINNAGLFAARLVSENLTDPLAANCRLEAMRRILPGAYYLEFYLGRNFISLGLLDEALAHLRAALDLEPDAEDLPYIYSYMGDCLKNLGRYSEALPVLTEGLVHDEERPDIHNIMGVCYFKLADYQRAIKHFHRAVELVPSSAIDYANLGVNYRRLGRLDQARQYFELALGLDPGIDFAREQLAELG